MHNPRAVNSKKISKIAMLGFGLAVVVVLTAALSGFGHRFQWWHFSTGFTLLRWSFYGASVAAILCLIGLIVTRRGRVSTGFGMAIVGLVLSLGLLGMVGNYVRIVRSVPMIHDITTDMDNPPAFEVLLAVRQAVPNGADYSGPNVAAQQKRAYPDIAPAILAMPPPQTFDNALAVARELGWEIVAAQSKAGRIEATDTTFWYGFKDDVVIRITPQDSGSRLDIRSVSRVGKSDIGANAARIRTFLDKLRET